MIDIREAKITLKIRRLKCQKCRKIHHELPDCIVPYKRHGAETIEAIIDGRSEEVPCDNRTIRRIERWWSIMLPYYINIMKSLTEKYQIEFHEPPLFREIIRAVVNTNSWNFARKICTRTDCMSG